MEKLLHDKKRTTAYKGIIITGPHGSGNMSCMNAAINAANKEDSPITYLRVQDVRMNTCYWGGTEKNFRGLFSEAIEKSPSVIVVLHRDLILRDDQVDDEPVKI